MLTRPWRPITIGIVLLMSMAAFESIAVATAMPVIAQALNALDGYTWAFTGFIVASIPGMVTAGVWSDARGPRVPVISGAVAFAIGSIVSGAAPSLAVLVAGRLVQGVGSGAVIVAIYVIIVRTYPEALHPQAFSVLSTAWVLPALLGPPIAGWLAETLSWRIVFWLVPVLVIWPVIVIARHLPADGKGAISAEGWRRIRMGALAALGLYAVQDGALRTGPVAVVVAALGIVVVAVAARALLPNRALTFARGLPTSVMMRGFVAAGFFSAEVFVPLALVQIRGVGTTLSGAVLSVAAVTWALGSAAQSRVRADADRARLTRIGAALVTVGVLSVPLALLDSVPYLIVAGSWAVAAFGMGLAIPSIALQSMRLTSADDQGKTSAGLQFIESVSVTVAAVLVGVVYAVAERAGEVSSTTFTVIYAVSAAIAGLAVVLAPRMRPRLTP